MVHEEPLLYVGRDGRGAPGAAGRRLLFTNRL